MHDPLREAASDLFGQRREAATGGKDLLRIFLVEMIVPLFPIQSTRRSSESTLN